MVQSLKIAGLVASIGLLAACDNDVERGVSGAAIGAAAASVTNNNVATGAAIGAVAGVFCDDANICQ